MYTVRQLIIDAFKRSSVRGMGDTPDDLETEDALGMLNDILDVLSRKQEFCEGNVSFIVNKPQEREYVTFGNPKDRVFSAIADNGYITLNFSAPHGLVEGELVDVRIGGMDIPTMVFSVTSPTSVTIPPSGSLSGCYKGSLKKRDEGSEYLIDIITTPPVNIYEVIASGKGKLDETQEQFFYVGGAGDGWFYEKTRNPYPKLYVRGSDRVKVVFPKPVYRNLTLDDDIEGMDDSARVAIKYRLAAEIAGSNGFDEKMKTLLSLYRHAYATFARSGSHTSSPDPDTSAPGYSGGSYNIYTDGASNESF